MLRYVHMICDLCEGKVYPRQCRNSAAFRTAHSCPDACPYGIPLDNLPIGDNRPGRPRSIFRGRNACAYLQVIPTGGCCDNEYRCLQRDHRRINTPLCGTCPAYAAATHPASSRGE